MRFNFFKNKWFWLVVTFLLTIPAFSFLLKPGYYNMHDDMQMIRQLEMEKCLKDGQIPCRWTPDLGYGYGYPLFNFYPPMPYVVGQIFRFFGFSFVVSVKLTAVFQIILSSIFMFILASSLFGNLGGLISALFYTYAPYHAVNIYIRGAMNEAWAGVFFPLIFYFSRKLILEKKNKFIVGLGISLAGLLLSHNPMVLTFAPIFAIWCLFWLFYTPFKNQFSIILKLFLSGIFALSLTAFYTLPVLFETKLVQIDTMFQNYYHFSVHFVTVYQLFISLFWGDGASVWGPNDDMSFMIGYLHWIFPLFIFIYFLILIVRCRKIKKINKSVIISVILLILGFGAAFMTHNKSTFLWLIFTPIQKIQFPWRFLSHVAFLLSLSVGVIPTILEKIIKEKSTIIFTGLILILLITLNIKYFHPLKSGPITDAQKFSGLSWTNQITSGIYDYLPKTARIAPLGPAKDFVDEINPKNIVYKITDSKKGTDWSVFNVNLNRPAKVTLAQLAFPTFEVQDNGKKINYTIEPELGRIVINLSSGDHKINVKFKNTPIRTFSNFISLIGWSLIIVLSIKSLWMKLIFKK